MIYLAEVFHVGAFERDQKRHGSHEGEGLSVSLDPEAWRAIARLGDHPTWGLRCDEGAFVDVHAVRGSPALFGQVIKWAAHQGYLTRGRLAELHLKDDAGESVVELFATHDEAERERAALGDLHAPIAMSERYLMTPRMAERAMSLRTDNHALALDHALNFFVEDRLPSVDGLWWADDFDPLGLSAPRGVICRSRLGRWRVERLHPD